MYLWNTKKLAVSLRNDEVGEKEKFKYFIVLLIILGPPISFGLLEELEELHWVDVVSSLAMLTIVIIGSLKSFRTNCAGDNKNFIERFVCLAVPLGIKLTILTILAIVIVDNLTTRLISPYLVKSFTAVETLNEQMLAITLLVASLVTAVITVLFFKLMIKYIRFISGLKNSI